VAVTPLVMTENPETPFARQVKGVSTLVWKKTPAGWRIIHEHESLQP
jgi:ketosteroid isomerase-like protein